MTRHDRPDFFRPELAIICGIAGAIGAIVPNILNILAGLIAQHDFIADTISDLGRGPHKWIMDTGFYINAAGLISLSIGSAHAHLGGRRWSAGLLCLALLALVTVMLGLWDTFGGTDMSVHTRLTFLLAPLYLFGPLAMVSGLNDRFPKIRLLFLLSSGLWLVFAVAFKLVPDSMDGLFERLAVLATLLWILPLSWVLVRVGVDG